jgi:hypothetical protein
VDLMSHPIANVLLQKSSAELALVHDDDLICLLKVLHHLDLIFNFKINSYFWYYEGRGKHRRL